MPDDGGDELRDRALHEEIELVGDLVVAAGSSGDRLTQAEIDEVLGVEPAEVSDPREEPSGPPGRQVDGR